MKIAVIAAIALACSATAAAADSVPTKARTLADRGRAAHDQHDYAGAIAAFTEAYAIAPAPALLFNLAQAYRLAGRCDDASLMYRRFLATGPSDDARVLADMHLAAVERCIRAQSLRVFGDPTIATASLPQPSVESTPEPVDERHPFVPSRKLGIGLAAGGGVALVIAGYYALDAHGTASEVERRYQNGEKWKQLQALDAQGARSSSIAKVAAVTGVIAAATGATLLVLEHRARRSHAKRRLDVAPLGRGAKVSLAWQF